VALRRAAICGGRVVDEEGRPVALAEVSLRPHEPPPGTVGTVELAGEDEQHTHSDEDGRFEFATVTPGEYEVDAFARGYQPAEPQDLLEVAGDAEGLRYSLAPAAGLALAVRLASGRRPPYVHLAVFDAAGWPLVVESRKSDDAGKAFFPTVPAGEWELLVGAPGGAPARAQVSGPVEPAEVVLSDAGRLQVRLPGLVESNVQARLRLTGPDALAFRSFDDTGRIRDTWELRNGTATVEGVPAGEWNVQVVAADGASWQGVVVATGAPVTEVEMQ